MKSGTKGKSILVSKKFSIKLDWGKINSDFKDAHQSDACKGEFELVVLKDVPFNAGDLGLTTLPSAPFLKCKKCDAMYFAPKFEEIVNEMLAASLILEPKLLQGKQLRFLRVHASMSQQEIADFLGLTRPHYTVQEKTGGLSASDQVRLKMLYAEKIGIDKVAELFLINRIDLETAAAPIPIGFSERMKEINDQLASI